MLQEKPVKDGCGLFAFVMHTPYEDCRDKGTHKSPNTLESHTRPIHYPLQHGEASKFVQTPET